MHTFLSFVRLISWLDDRAVLPLMHQLALLDTKYSQVLFQYVQEYLLQFLARLIFCLLMIDAKDNFRMSRRVFLHGYNLVAVLQLDG